MKEALQVALDEKQELDDRVQALDNFEMVSRLPGLVWVCERCAYLTLFLGSLLRVSIMRMVRLLFCSIFLNPF